MNKYRKTLRNWYKFSICLGIYILIITILRGFKLQWKVLVLNQEALSVPIGIFTGLFALIYGMKNLSNLKSQSPRESGLDERTVKIQNIAIRNGCIVFFFTMFIVVGIISLVYDWHRPLLSVNHFRILVWPGFITYLVSVWYYSKSKKL